MKTSLQLLAFAVLLTAKVVNGQSTSTLMGGRSMGLSNASSTLSDSWALWNNPAGLAPSEAASAAFALHRSPTLPGADRWASCVALPFGTVGVFGIGAFHFGDQLYSEQLITMGYANQLGLASLGVRLNLMQLRTEGFPTRFAWGIVLGGTATLGKRVRVGAYINNVNQPRLPNGELLPIQLVSGLQFKPAQKFLMVFEVEKDLDRKPAIRCGMEYQFHKKLSARTGFQLQTLSVSAGLGYSLAQLRVDYAFQYHSLLGASQQIATSILLRKKKKSTA
jgi:hypothetical protein